MKLSDFFSSKKTPEDALVLSLIVSSTTVQAALLRCTETEIVVEERSSLFKYNQIEDCILKADEALQRLGQQSESVSHVAFGLEDGWIDASGQVVESAAPLLSRLSTDLSLEPVGYVVVSDALIQEALFQDSHASVIVLSVSYTQLTCTLVQHGRLLVSQRVGRSESLVADVTEAVAQIAQQLPQDASALPSQIILASLDDSPAVLDALHQQLLEVNWQSISGFVSVPVITTEPSDEVRQALFRQAGIAVAVSRGWWEPSTQATVTGSRVTALTDELRSEAANVEPIGAMEEVFYQDETSDETDEAQSPNSIRQVTTFGVPVASSVVDRIAPSEQYMAHDYVRSRFADRQHSKASSAFQMRKASRGYTKQHMVGFAVAGVALGLVTLLALGYTAAHAWSRVVVTVKPARQMISQEVIVQVSSKATVSDPATRVLAAKEVSKEVTVTQSKPVSGVKVEGEKSKGIIKIINKTTAEKTLPASTVVTTGDFSFQTTEAVTVPPAKVTQKPGGEEKEYGSKEVGVVASQIGADHNLSQGTTLTVKPFDTTSFTAEVSKALTGGSSKEVAVVSEKDYDQLLAIALKEATKQANEQFLKENVANTFYLPTQKAVVVKKEFSHEVQTQTAEVSLTLTANVTALSYTSKDLEPLATGVLQAHIPAGFELDTSAMSVTSESLSNSQPVASNSAAVESIELQVSAPAQVIISSDEVKTVVAGKPLSEVSDSLATHLRVSEVSVQLYPEYARFFVSSAPDQHQAIEVNIAR